MTQYLTQILDWFRRSSGAERPEEHDRSYEPVWISEPLVERTQAYLHSFCDKEISREGLVYWSGVQMGRGGVITTLLVPDADAGPGYVKTSPVENAGVIADLADHNLVLLGQAHSHPPGAGTRHSPGDDEMTFSPFEGAISVVAADYARKSAPESWGVHRFIDGHYQWIPEDERHEHFRIVPAERDHRLRAAR